MDYSVAFGDNPALYSKITAALVSKLPASAILPDINAHVLSLKCRLAAGAGTASAPYIPAKKRSANDEDTAAGVTTVHSHGAKRAKREHTTSTNGSWLSEVASAAAQDVSFMAPVRKKMALELFDGVGLRGLSAGGAAEAAIVWDDVGELSERAAAVLVV